MNIIQDLLSINKYSRCGITRSQTLALVVHWVGNPNTSAKTNKNYFESLSGQINKKPRYASAHYIVGLEGETIQCIPENELAYHVGSSQIDPESGKIYTNLCRSIFNQSNPNYKTIGIEICHPDKSGKFLPETLRSVNELCVDILARYKLNPRLGLLRHYDIVGWKECPLWFVKHEDEWINFKKEIALTLGRNNGF